MVVDVMTALAWLIGAGCGASAVLLVQRLRDKRLPLTPGETYRLPSGDLVEIMRVWSDGDVWFRKLTDPVYTHRVMSYGVARRVLRLASQEIAEEAIDKARPSAGDA